MTCNLGCSYACTLPIFGHGFACPHLQPRTAHSSEIDFKKSICQSNVFVLDSLNLLWKIKKKNTETAFKSGSQNRFQISWIYLASLCRTPHPLLFLLCCGWVLLLSKRLGSKLSDAASDMTTFFFLFSFFLSAHSFSIKPTPHPLSVRCKSFPSSVCACVLC